MRLSTRLSLVSSAAIIVATAACGSDSTGPPSGGDHTPGTLAQHFDTLYSQAKALSASNAKYNLRTEILSNLELAAAFGSSPTDVTVTTSTGTETWKAFVFEEVRNVGGVPSDSGYIIVAYRDSLAHTAIETGVHADGTTLGAFLSTNDTISVLASANSGLASLLSNGSACPTPIAGLVNPVIAVGEAATCTSATIQAAHTSEFPSTSGVPAAYTHFSFSAMSFPGERFFDPLSGTSQLSITSSLERMFKANH